MTGVGLCVGVLGSGYDPDFNALAFFKTKLPKVHEVKSLTGAVVSTSNCPSGRYQITLRKEFLGIEFEVGDTRLVELSIGDFTDPSNRLVPGMQQAVLGMILDEGLAITFDDSLNRFLNNSLIRIEHG